MEQIKNKILSYQNNIDKLEDIIKINNNQEINIINNNIAINQDEKKHIENLKSIKNKLVNEYDILKNKLNLESPLKNNKIKQLQQKNTLLNLEISENENKISIINTDLSELRDKKVNLENKLENQKKTFLFEKNNNQKYLENIIEEIDLKIKKTNDIIEGYTNEIITIDSYKIKKNNRHDKDLFAIKKNLKNNIKIQQEEKKKISESKNILIKQYSESIFNLETNFKKINDDFNENTKLLETQKKKFFIEFETIENEYNLLKCNINRLSLNNPLLPKKKEKLKKLETSFENIKNTIIKHTENISLLDENYQKDLKNLKDLRKNIDITHNVKIKDINEQLQQINNNINNVKINHNNQYSNNSFNDNSYLQKKKENLNRKNILSNKQTLLKKKIDNFNLEKNKFTKMKNHNLNNKFLDNENINSDINSINEIVKSKNLELQKNINISNDLKKIIDKNNSEIENINHENSVNKNNKQDTVNQMNEIKTRIEYIENQIKNDTIKINSNKNIRKLNHKKNIDKSQIRQIQQKIKLYKDKINKLNNLL